MAARKTRTRKKTTARKTRKPTARRGTKAARSAAAKKAWRTRRRNASAKSRSKKSSSSSRRRPTKAKRSAAARKAAATRKRNAAKRSRAAKKAAATRKRNSKRKTTKRKGKGRTAAKRRTAAKKAAATRKRNAAKRSRAAKKAAATRRRNSGKKRRSSKRRTSKRRTYKRRSTKMKGLGKMFKNSGFLSSVKLGLQATVLAAVGLGVYGVTSGVASGLIPSAITGLYDNALSYTGGFSATADALVKVGLATVVVTTAMDMLINKTKLIGKPAKMYLGKDAAAKGTIAAVAVIGSQLLMAPGVMGSGVLANMASGNANALINRIPGFSGGLGMSNKKMFGHKNNHMMGMYNNMAGHGMNHNNMMTMGAHAGNNLNVAQQNIPNNNSNLFGTRSARRGKVNLF